MIIIPMMGKSSRFINAGYTSPKYMLDLHNKPLFNHAVESFSSYFGTESFTFIIRNDGITRKFIKDQIQLMGIDNYEIIELNEDTLGQAHTVYIALKQLKHDNEFFVFNIDTIRLNFLKPSFLGDCDGYIEVFKGFGEDWSFVYPENNYLVKYTTEKNRVSNLCSDGLYYFKNVKSYLDVFETAVKNNETVKNEYYIAPMYNKLISNGQKIYYEVIDVSQLIMCGTPGDYESLLKLG